jgi:hypothetical protein
LRYGLLRRRNVAAAPFDDPHVMNLSFDSLAIVAATGFVAPLALGFVPEAGAPEREPDRRGHGPDLGRKRSGGDRAGSGSSRLAELILGHGRAGRVVTSSQVTQCYLADVRHPGNDCAQSAVCVSARKAERGQAAAHC